MRTQSERKAQEQAQDQCNGSLSVSGKDAGKPWHELFSWLSEFGRVVCTMDVAPIPSRALGALSETTQVRLFFGLDPSADEKRALGEWRDQYAYADGRPVPIDNLHLTLAFIGEVDNRQLDSLCDETDEWLSDRTATVVTLELCRVGYFPRPSIYWLGSNAVPRDLENLQAGVQARAMTAGARRESRAWVPHVTLYRQCEAPPAPLREPQFTLKFAHLTLFESITGRSGVRYEPVAEWTI